MLALFRTALAAALLSSVPPPALAQSDEHARERAAELYDEGLAHYQLAEYPQAIEKFKTAYREVPDPELLFDIAQSYRRMGDCESALEFYRNYRIALADRGDEPPVALASHVTDMERCVEKRAPSSDPVQPGGTPAADTEGGAEATATVEGSAPPGRTPWLELGVGAAGIASAATGTVLLARASSRADDLWAECGSACDRDDVGDLRFRKRLGTGLVIGGAAAAAGGLLLWWWRDDGSGETPALTVAPRRDGLMVTAELWP